ncbi:hypothetical protein [Brevibacillus sp. SYSU BS000544]|uniref:hypothetical protein n=1 Tax=Brevibacillus sp. SYSU BS000544 TaxID=3416443 RepID=UPI003CE4E4DE
MKNLMIASIIASLLLGACSSTDNRLSEAPKASSPKQRDIPKGCPDGIIDWAHLVKWNDINYVKNFESDISGLIKGEKIGEVEFTMNDVACSDYQMINGDATIAPIGTLLYRVQGYEQDYRIFVGNDLYEAKEKPNVKTLGDLYDIEGKVKKISFESTEDGSLLYDFTPEATSEFVLEFLKLEYKGFNEVYKFMQHDEQKVFLRFTLQDGSSFRESYWYADGVIASGLANDQLKEILLSQMKK